jgi:hypothetical protein
MKSSEPVQIAFLLDQVLPACAQTYDDDNGRGSNHIQVVDVGLAI